VTPDRRTGLPPDHRIYRGRFLARTLRRRAEEPAPLSASTSAEPSPRHRARSAEKDRAAP